MFAIIMLSVAALAAASPTGVQYMPDTVLLDARAASAAPTPINFTVGVTIPTVAQPSTTPYISLGGYQIPLVRDAQSGSLVSFLGNFANSKVLMAQLTGINPSAPQNVTTSSSSTSVEGGNSQSNATASADQARIVSTTFSSGNASSGSAAQGSGSSSTSSSSSGASNSSSTAVADASGLTSIFTSANTADASNAQSVQNADAASAATSCAAQNTGAESDASEITTVQIPVGQPSQHLSVVSSAYAACAAGVAPPQQGTSSSSGSQASLTGVSSSVTCNGITSTHQTTSTTFRLRVVGTYSQTSGFSGAITGQRVASSASRC